jgi:hypothetical protein
MVLVVVPLSLLAAGCGGSSGSSAPPTTTTAGASGASGPQTAALTAFTSCLKQHGITTTGFGGFGGRPRGASGRFGPAGASGRFGPSGASGRFGPAGASGRRGGGFGRNLTAAQQKAFTACRSKLPAGTGGFRPGGGAGGGAANPAFAKYTQCLAKHGVKFGTASASGAAFAKASKACAKLRPAVGGAPTTTTTG